MKIVAEHDLLDVGNSKEQPEISEALDQIRCAIRGLVWPPGSDRFTIYPQSGKKTGEGNGVRPIRDAFVLELGGIGWDVEKAFPIQNRPGMGMFGAMDASKDIDGKPFVVEWETGNISSSHRAMNKMGVGLIQGAVAAGVLILPSRELYRFLTDRIGNIWELRPYFPLWQSLKIKAGYLGVFVVQHDAESTDVERIRKGTDGRALI